MNRGSPVALALLVALLFAAGCGDDGAVDPGPALPDTLRPYALGFTDFPHAFSQEGVDAAWTAIGEEGDMAAMHFDGGVPWPEALAAIRYAEPFMAELNLKESRIPIGHVTYLAVTPIDFERDGLAAYRGAEENMPLPEPWDTLGFDADAVVFAFTEHCDYMIQIFTPDFFAYAIEANILLETAPETWPAFVTLARFVYTAIKGKYPALPVFLTIQAEFFAAAPQAQADSLALVMPFTDMIAASSYAFTSWADPDDVPADHYRRLAALAPEKPFAWAETGWPAEDVTAPSPVTILADTAAQRRFVERLLGDADSLDARFVNWFFSRDFDDLWDSRLQYLDNAPLLRLWRDCGLRAGDGAPRPALDAWRKRLATARRP